MFSTTFDFVATNFSTLLCFRKYSAYVRFYKQVIITSIHRDIFKLLILFSQSFCQLWLIFFCLPFLYENANNQKLHIRNTSLHLILFVPNNVIFKGYQSAYVYCLSYSFAFLMFPDSIDY